MENLLTHRLAGQQHQCLISKQDISQDFTHNLRQTTLISSLITALGAYKLQNVHITCYRPLFLCDIIVLSSYKVKRDNDKDI